jgi:hypothetical protein
LTPRMQFHMLSCGLGNSIYSNISPLKKVVKLVMYQISILKSKR